MISVTHTVGWTPLDILLLTTKRGATRCRVTTEVAFHKKKKEKKLCILIVVVTCCLDLLNLRRLGLCHIVHTLQLYTRACPA